MINCIVTIRTGFGVKRYYRGDNEWPPLQFSALGAMESQSHRRCFMQERSLSTLVMRQIYGTNGCIILASARPSVRC
jgi:hypothetical protein